MSLKDNVFDTASGMNTFEKTAQMSKRPITFELVSLFVVYYVLISSAFLSYIKKSIVYPNHVIMIKTKVLLPQE